MSAAVIVFRGRSSGPEWFVFEFVLCSEIVYALYV
jgi:hypothetical protein